MCKRFRMKLVNTHGRIMAILAPAGARNAWEIKRCLFTMLYPTRNIIGADMVTIESNVRKTLYSYAPTVTESVPGDGKRGVTRSLHNGKLCIVLDGELPIP